MRKSSGKAGNSVTIAIIFLCSIALLLAAGLFLKLFLILRASSFDGAHQYIIEVDESKQKGALVAFDPDTKSISVLTITGSVDKTFGEYLGVPTDGFMRMAIPSNANTLTQNMIFDGKGEEGITIIDRLRLLIFVNSVPAANFHAVAITLPVDSVTTDKLLPSLFLDNTIYTDNESVSVVNATGESGVATTVAHFLTTIGTNVISVTSSNTTQDNTDLTTFQGNTYTVHRIEKLFHVTSRIVTTASVSDITLTIGKKSLSQLQ